MSEEIPTEFWRGVDQFNQGQFYDCHDTLEALWMEATEPNKTFYQGVLQLAVALYHLENLNWRGAVILLGEGTRKLNAYPAAYSGIDVDRLVDQSGDLLHLLQQGGVEQVEQIADQVQTERPTIARPELD